MTCASAVTPVVSPALPAASRARRLSPAAAFYLQASITISFLAGSSAPTPLYPLYQSAWGFSPVTVTLIFGVYAIAVLSALVVTGRLSDYVGRRPVLMAAVAVQVLTMLMFAHADGLGALLIARVLQGLSTGAAVAALGAGMLDLDKTRGAVANAVAPPMGTALGAIAAGLMVHYLPAPTHLVYYVLALVFVVQGLGVMLMTESMPSRPGALASLKPQFTLPAATRDPMLRATPILIAAWALAGFYASLGPALVHSNFGLDSSLLGGIALFVLAASGATAVLLLQGQDAGRMMSFGASALLAGVAIADLSLFYHSITAFFIGTALAGMGFGGGFQGAVRSIVPFAAGGERAGVLSVIFVVAYLAMGLPAVGAGYLVARHGDILGTAREFEAAVMALGALALMGALTRRPS